MNSQPTIDVYKGRLERLLSNALASARQAHAQLALEGMKHGHSSDTSSGFRLQEDQLAKREFLAAMELALSECRRASGLAGLDVQEVFDVTCDATRDYLGNLLPILIRPPNPAFSRSTSDGGRAERVREELLNLMGEVFHEYRHGLYTLPGDLAAPVVINVTNVDRSTVHGAIQQAGSGSAQSGRGGE